MTDRDDTELQRYIDGGSRLSRRYRDSSRESPPSELDAAILAEARAAVGVRPQRSRSLRWTLPLAVAATMLLGVNLVWLMHDRGVPTPPGRPAQGVASVAAEPVPAPVLAESDTAAPQPRRQQPAKPVPPASAAAESALADATREAVVPPPDALSAAQDAAAAGTREERSASISGVAGPRAPEPPEDAPRAKRAAPQAEMSQALQADAAADADDGGVDVAQLAMRLGRALQAGEFATVRALVDADAVPDAQLQRAASALETAGPLQWRVKPDPAAGWTIDYFGSAGDSRCQLRLEAQDAGWRLLEIVVP